MTNNHGTGRKISKRTALLIILASSLLVHIEWLVKPDSLKITEQSASEWAHAASFMHRLESGDDPWFDPSVGLGGSFLDGEPHITPFNPVFWALTTNSPLLAALTLVLLLAIAGAGIFWTAMKSGVSELAAMTAALALCLQGSLSSYFGQADFLVATAAAIMSWLAYIIMEPYASRMKTVSMLAILLALAATLGHPAVTGTILFGMTIWTLGLFLSRRMDRATAFRVITNFTWAVVLAILLSSAYLFSRLSNASSLYDVINLPLGMSTYSWMRTSDVLVNSLAPLSLVKRTHVSLFIGLTSSFLIIFPILFETRKWLSSGGPAALILLVTGLLVNSGGKDGLAVTAVLCPLGLALSVGIGIESLLVLRSGRPRLLYRADLILILVGSLLMFFSVLEPVSLVSIEDQESPFPHFMWIAFFMFMTWSIIRISRKGIVQSRGMALGLLLILVVEISIHGLLTVDLLDSGINPSRFFQSNPFISALEKDPRHIRTAMFETGLTTEKQHLSPLKLMQKGLIYGGIAAIRTQDCMCKIVSKAKGVPLSWPWIRENSPKTPGEIGDKEQLEIREGGPTDRLLDLLQIKYLVTNVDVLGEAFFELFDFDGSSMWENRYMPGEVTRFTHMVKARDAAQAIDMYLSPGFDPENQVVVQDSHRHFQLGKKPGGVEVDYIVDRQGNLVFDIKKSTGEILTTPFNRWTPWRITIDKKKAVPLKVNGCFIGIYVPPGNHEVSIAYRSGALWSGGTISFLALIMIIALLVIKTKTE
ncbi:MAG: YfhO family protein [Deltaproteobacteria bacterium]|nr:YfhO family protein [Deltaproteobacteria bacterium]